MLVLRLVRENPSWGYRRVHGELLTLGVKGAASTVWEILREAGIDPVPDRAATTWAQFLRSQAQALLAADFLETVTLTGTKMYVLAFIEHASRRVRILGATAHPSAAWVTQTARNLVMDLQDTGCQVKYLIRDRDGKYPSLFDAVLADADINVVSSGVRMRRMNAVMAKFGVACYADAAYQAAGPHIAVPFRRRPRRLSANQKAVNRNHARNRAPGERAVATLKTWKVLTKLRCCPLRATPIVAAIRVLQAIDDQH